MKDWSITSSTESMYRGCKLTASKTYRDFEIEVVREGDTIYVDMVGHATLRMSLKDATWLANTLFAAVNAK